LEVVHALLVEDLQMKKHLAMKNKVWIGRDLDEIRTRPENPKVKTLPKPRPQPSFSQTAEGVEEATAAHEPLLPE